MNINTYLLLASLFFTSPLFSSDSELIFEFEDAADFRPLTQKSSTIKEKESTALAFSFTEPLHLTIFNDHSTLKVQHPTIIESCEFTIKDRLTRQMLSNLQIESEGTSESASEDILNLLADTAVLTPPCLRSPITPSRKDKVNFQIEFNLTYKINDLGHISIKNKKNKRKINLELPCNERIKLIDAKGNTALALKIIFTSQNKLYVTILKLLLLN